MPTAPSVVSCGTIPPLAAPYVSSYAIAATDSEVGLAEVAYNDTYGMSLSFRRLTPSLDIASNTTLLDPLQQGPLPAAYIDGVAVAPLPSGWVIASCLAGHLYLFTVEASGVSSVRVPVTIDDSGCGSSMVLAARPGGGPLLVWLSGYGMRGALIAADGQSAGTPFDLVEPEIGSGGLFDAAWVGDAFNVSLSIFLPPDFYDSALRIARVDVNGNVNGGFDLLMDGFEECPASRAARRRRASPTSPATTPAPRPSSGGGSDRRASSWPMPSSQKRFTTTRNLRRSRSATTPSCSWPTTVASPRRSRSRAWAAMATSSRPVRHPARADLPHRQP
jgi:hypothetical protein